ncbi:hypothetical protein [Chryseobacterium wangxinyae]|uniref:hypothetical protein n=1 Tax=Chryseobacterium sp. CY353 TaxID=2997334 RepID=UPI00226FDF03|nr:hypothetical protein [Chryseobacterium sp. CY353]MCY0970320.1 hypothetical protein [Chryseobacterium sp. CY353]
MTEDIIINLKFNENIERDNQNFYFKYVWKKAFKSWIKIIVFTFTVVFLFLGFYPIENFDTNLLYYIIKYMEIFLSGYRFILIYQYFASKKKFKNEVESIIAEYKETDQISYIGMNDKEIEFKNPFNTISSVWGKTSFLLQDNYLLINPIKLTFHY